MIQMADRVGLSHNKTVGIVSSVLKSGKDVKGKSLSLRDFTISKSTATRSRNVNRQKIAEERHKEFESKKPHHAAAHFDGKMLPGVFGKMEDRLSILISGPPNYIEGKLLGIVSMVDDQGNPSSKGNIQAKEVWKAWL